MKIILFLLALLAGFESASVFHEAKSAIHQIYGAVMLVVAAILLVGAAIVRAFDKTVDYAKAEVDKELGKTGKP